MAVQEFGMGDLMELLVARIGLPRDTVTGDQEQTVAGLGLDSLALIQLNAEIEERLGVQLGDERPDMTFREILAAINEGLSEPAE